MGGRVLCPTSYMENGVCFSTSVISRLLPTHQQRGRKVGQEKPDNRARRGVEEETGKLELGGERALRFNFKYGKWSESVEAVQEINEK